MNVQENLSALPAGYRLQEYEIASILGVGGFGITYLATDTQLGMAVAIKEYLPNTLAVRTAASTVLPKSGADERDYRWGLERFMEEARTLACFRHPNIVRVLRFFTANGTGYTVMDYEHGESLAEHLRRHPTPLGEVQLIELVRPLLDGLKRVHAAGFLHRDIKPANIYLRRDGTPVLLDFGSARLALSGHTRNLTTVFTPGYAPFEQYFADGRQGPWTDIYALGAVLYRIATGATPPEAARRIKDDTLVPATELCQGRLSARLTNAIDRALAMDEEQRPQSIDAWLALLGESAAPPQEPEPVVPSPATAEAPTLVLSKAAPTRGPRALTTPAPRPAALRRGRAQPVRRRRVAPALLIVLALLAAYGALRHTRARRPQALPTAMAKPAARPPAEPARSPASAAAASSAPSEHERPPRPADAGPGPTFAPAAATQPPPTPSTALDSRLAQADTNGDGQLSRAETQAAFPRLARRFDLIDTNHDGQLSAQEIQHAAQLMWREGRRARERAPR